MAKENGRAGTMRGSLGRVPEAGRRRRRRPRRPYDRTLAVAAAARGVPPAVERDSVKL